MWREEEEINDDDLFLVMGSINQYVHMWMQSKCISTL